MKARITRYDVQRILASARAVGAAKVTITAYTWHERAHCCVVSDDDKLAILYKCEDSSWSSPGTVEVPIEVLRMLKNAREITILDDGQTIITDGNTDVRFQRSLACEERALTINGERVASFQSGAWLVEDAQCGSIILNDGQRLPLPEAIIKALKVFKGAGTVDIYRDATNVYFQSSHVTLRCTL